MVTSFEQKLPSTRLRRVHALDLGRDDDEGRQPIREQYSLVVVAIHVA